MNWPRDWRRSFSHRGKRRKSSSRSAGIGGARNPAVQRMSQLAGFDHSEPRIRFMVAAFVDAGIQAPAGMNISGVNLSSSYA